MGRKKKVNPIVLTDNDPIAVPLDFALEDYSKPAPEEIKPPIEIDASRILDGEQPKEEKQRKARKPKESQGDLLIDGETLLMFIDLIIPMIVATANNQITDKKISADDLMLSEKQKAQMRKLADKVADKIDINVNPVMGLLVGLAGMYAYKFIELKNK